MPSDHPLCCNASPRQIGGRRLNHHFTVTSVWLRAPINISVFACAKKTHFLRMWRNEESESRAFLAGKVFKTFFVVCFCHLAMSCVIDCPCLCTLHAYQGYLVRYFINVQSVEMGFNLHVWDCYMIRKIIKITHVQKYANMKTTSNPKSMRHRQNYLHTDMWQIEVYIFLFPLYVYDLRANVLQSSPSTSSDNKNS